MTSVIKQMKTSRFDNHALVYTVLYWSMLAPPRAHDIKRSEKAKEGELAQFPTFFVAAIEWVVRVSFLLILAAGIEGLVGNAFYETHRLDIFFVTLVATGSVHSAMFYLIFNADGERPKKPIFTILYRMVRNTGYAALCGFMAVVPVVIYRWDNELAPYSDGLAIQAYAGTALVFLVIGVIEAITMKRMPLGTISKHDVSATDTSISPTSD